MQHSDLAYLPIISFAFNIVIYMDDAKKDHTAADYNNFIFI